MGQLKAGPIFSGPRLVNVNQRSPWLEGKGHCKPVQAKACTVIQDAVTDLRLLVAAYRCQGKLFAQILSLGSDAAIDSQSTEPPLTWEEQLAPIIDIEDIPALPPINIYRRKIKQMQSPWTVVPEMDTAELSSNNIIDQIPGKAVWQSAALLHGENGELYSLTCRLLKCSWNLLPLNFVKSSIVSNERIPPWLVKLPQAPRTFSLFKWWPIDRQTEAYHTHYHNGKLS